MMYLDCHTCDQIAAMAARTSIGCNMVRAAFADQQIRLEPSGGDGLRQSR